MLTESLNLHNNVLPRCVLDLLKYMLATDGLTLFLFVLCISEVLFEDNFFFGVRRGKNIGETGDAIAGYKLRIEIFNVILSTFNHLSM